MFGTSQNGAKAYSKVAIETGISSASPHTLIVMLFDGALIAVTTALQNMRAGNIAGKGQAISKAITIIDSGLRASLNKEAGGEIAENLDSLYQYMSNRLLIANLNNRPEILEEVQRLIRDLKGAWEAIGAPAGQQAPAPVEIPRPTAYDPLVPHTSRLMKA